jgi:hypothetical protein
MMMDNDGALVMSVPQSRISPSVAVNDDFAPAQVLQPRCARFGR